MRDIAIIYKDVGVVVHPRVGSKETLVNYLLYHLDNLSGIGGRIRSGIVHRLDKNSSGVMIVAKNDLSHINFSEQFKKRLVVNY